MIRLMLSLLPSLLCSFDFQGYVGAEYRIFDNESVLKRDSSKAFEAQLELKHKGDEYSLTSSMNVLKDEDEDARTFARMNEFYFTKHFENSDISLGRGIYFMGALEILNPVDTINRQDFGRDLLDDRYKIGSYMVVGEYYTDDDMQITLMAYMTERADEFGDAFSPYNIFGARLNKNILSEHNSNNPSFMIKIQSTLDEDYALDYAYGLSRGYDNQRTFTENFRQKQWMSTTAFTYNTLAYENTLYKLEARVSDIDENIEANMDDYLYFGAGIEHTFAALYDNIDLALLGEYYNYIRIDEKFANADEMMILMQNDIFLGLRIAANNASSTELVGGAIFDFDDSSEQNYYIQAKSRIFDTFLLELDLRYMKPSSNRTTLLSLIGRHSSIVATFRYYF